AAGSSDPPEPRIISAATTATTAATAATMSSGVGRPSRTQGLPSSSGRRRLVVGRCGAPGEPGSWARRLRLTSFDSRCAWSRRSSSVASGHREDTPALRLSLVSGRIGGVMRSSESSRRDGSMPAKGSIEGCEYGPLWFGIGYGPDVLMPDGAAWGPEESGGAGNGPEVLAEYAPGAGSDSDGGEAAPPSPGRDCGPEEPGEPGENASKPGFGSCSVWCAPVVDSYGIAYPPDGSVRGSYGTRTGPEGVSTIRDGSGPDGGSSGGSSPAGVESAAVGSGGGTSGLRGRVEPCAISTRSSRSATWSEVRRASGSFTSRPSITGSSAPARWGLTGSWVSTAPSTATASGPSYGGRPSTAAYSVAPNDHRSAATEIGLPDRRSGGM